MSKKKDLGDGVFAEYLPDHSIRLSVPDTTWNWNAPELEIILKPDTLMALGLWALKCAKEHGA